MSSLADFLKDQARDWPATPAYYEKQREEWLQALERLLGQMEAWLREADPEGALQVERMAVPVQEYGLGAYSAPGLTIHLGKEQVSVLPVQRNALAPPGVGRRDGRCYGAVRMTDGIARYDLYRQASGGKNGDQWVIVDDVEYAKAPFTQAAFEAAVVRLLQ